MTRTRSPFHDTRSFADVVRQSPGPGGTQRQSDYSQANTEERRAFSWREKAVAGPRGTLGISPVALTRTGPSHSQTAFVDPLDQPSDFPVGLPEASTAAQSPSRAAAPSSERPKRKDKPAKKLKTKKSKPCILRKPTRLGAKGSADTSKTKMNIEVDSEHTISERHFTEQLPANTSSIKGRSKVRVGKRKPAKVKPTTEIVEDDRLTGITIGNSGIQNMNRLIINGLEDLSAADIWAVGKTLGAEASGDELEVIKHLQAMEDRDQLQWVRETSRQANLRNEDVWRHAK
ncbi:hypothetical protein Ancab_000076 [Ancistrocladus abbreviatus]